MNNPIVPLIPITEQNGMTAVSLRDLHAFLEVTEKFTDWARRMFDYGFSDGADYVEVFPENRNNPTGGRPSRNWAISLDMAKELSMIQRTDKGKQARQYFIEVEKRKSVAPSGQDLLALAVIEAQRVLETQSQQIAELTPKAEAWESIVGSHGSWSFNDAAKAICEHGEIEIGEKRLFTLMENAGYLYRDAKRRPHVYQQFIKQGLFAVKARTYTDHATGETLESSAPQVRITGKGLDMIRTRLLNEKKAA